ncbi:hypothetical protein MMA231_04094 (plasmid) [Asticcacaulis sp. MM231]
MIDATRHLVSGDLDRLVQVAIKAYQTGDFQAGDKAVADLSDLTTRLDALLGYQQETLSSWIDDARAYGDTPAESAYYVENAKAQVSVWGGKGNLNDYASKAWQGMYKSFYLPRWLKLFSALRAGGFDQAAFTVSITTWEHDWVNDGQVYTRSKPSDPIAAARVLLARLEGEA